MTFRLAVPSLVFVGRLRDEDRRRIAELERTLLVLRLDVHFELERTLHELRHVLDVEHTAAWGAVREAEEFRLVFSLVSGCRVSPSGLQGQAAASQDLEEVASFLRPRLPEGKRELRLLLCSTPSLVAWLSAFQAAPFSARQEAILKALLPAFRRRVAAERALKDAPAAEAGLTAAMAAIARPAYLVDSAGCIRQLNAAGRGLLTRQRERVMADLASASGQPRDGIEVTPIEGAGLTTYLVVYLDDHGDLATRLEAATARWKLTPRQAEVLGRAATGESNKAIAAGLGRAESTIEIHITELLRRAGVTNRGTLVARFWALG